MRQIICEFCENGIRNPLISLYKTSQHLNVSQTTGILKDNTIMVTTTMIQTADSITIPPIVGCVGINYCPMCGKRLKTDEQ